MRELKPGSYKRTPLKADHPDSESHCMARWPTDRIPLLTGRRLPPRSCLGPDGDPAKAEEYYATALTLYMPWSLPDRPLFRSKPTLVELKARFDAWEQPPYAIVMLAHEEAFYQGRIMAQRLRAVRAEQETGGARACSSDSEDSEADGGAVDDAPAVHAVAKVHTLPVNIALALDALSAVARKSPQPTEPVPLPSPVQTAFDALQRLVSTDGGVAAHMDLWRAGADGPQTSSATGPAGCVGPTAGVDAKLLLVGAEIRWLAAGQQRACVSYGSKDVPAPKNVSLSSLAAAFRLDVDPRQMFVFQIAACQLLSAYLRSSDASAKQRADIALAQSDLATGVAAAGGGARRVVYLGGAGGCGKSNVVQAIRCFAQAWGIEFMVHTVAYTGMAAVNIGGCTMHHHVRLPGRFGFRGTNLPKQAADFAASIPYAAMAVLVIDEVSMVSAGMLGMYERAVTACCGGGAALFGGRVVLLAGDLLQMQPVGQTARIFDHHLLQDAAAELPAVVQHGLKVWRGIDTAVTLQINYRARCPHYRAFLNRFRRNEITDADRSILDTRCRIRFAARPDGGVRLPPPQCTAVMHDNASCGLLAATLAPLDGLSLRRQCVGVRPRYYPAADPHTARSGSGHRGVFFCDPVGGPPDNASRPFGRMTLFIGQQHCLQLTNTQQKLGLCNGVKGVLIGTHPQIFATGVRLAEMLEMGAAAESEAPMPEILFFYVPKFVSAYPHLSTGVLPMFPVTLPNQRVPDVAGVCKVEYFPCRSMEASTLHKIQGLTLPAVSIPSVRSGGSNTHSAYVGMSRVGSFDDLFIFPGARLTDVALFGRAQADGEETPVQTELRRLDSYPLNPFGARTQAMLDPEAEESDGRTD
jgi:hypothetical protein